MPRASARRCARRSASWRRPASGCRCLSPPNRRRSRRRCAIGAPVIELHTGAWCEALAAGDAAAAAAEFDRIVRGAAQAKNAGLEVHAGHGLDFVTAEKIAELGDDRRAQYRPFSRRRGDLRRACRGGAADAIGHGPRPVAKGSRIMILGIGSDITDARRIAKVIERHGERFLDRIFTPTERAKADKRRNRIETYAKRFAAKEACAKALGTGLRAGVWWRDMGVVNLPGGRPTMELTGGAKRRLQRITPAGYEARIDVTITDEGPMAHAFVVISAVPAGG